MVLDKLPAMGEAAFKQHLSWLARNTRVHKQRVRVDALRLQAKIDAEAQENTARWASFDAVAPGQPPDRFIRLHLPSGPRQQSNLAQRRRQRYRDHLNRLIAEAVSDQVVPAQSPDPTRGQPEADASARLAGQLCALCGGGCCTLGSDTAYLTPSTIRRFMALMPHLRPRDVLAAYLDRLSPKTQTRSCINHTASGCSLPREMRSDTCNNYLCGSQAAVQSRQQVGPPLQGAVVIQRRQDHWNRDALDCPNDIIGGATLTESGITPWPEGS
jgi:hypothetical protein